MYRAVLIGSVLTFAACHHLPESTRDGNTKEVFIHERSTFGVLQINAGDEMRWTNRRSVPVRITILDYVLNNLVCRRNFSGHYYSGADTDLLPKENASLCFREPGIVRYTVHSQGMFQRGESNVGHVHIEAFPRYTFQQEEERSASITQTVHTSWCEDDTTTQEQCL
jgi:hypothetical protein